jgi:hypothetical protein
VSTTSSTGKVPVGGAEIYYEIHGNGPPLVLLHGGVSPSDTFGAPLAAMAKTHKVIAIQQSLSSIPNSHLERFFFRDSARGKPTRGATGARAGGGASKLGACCKPCFRKWKQYEWSPVRETHSTSVSADAAIPDEIKINRPQLTARNMAPSPTRRRS